MSSASAPGSQSDLERDDRELLEDLVDVIERARLDMDMTDTELFNHDHFLWKRSTLPSMKLPSFGQPDETCGELIPEALHYCDCCYDVKELPHNCYSYDCPMHGLHAVRRRAAGQSGFGDDVMHGVAAKLGALRAKLDFRSDEPYYYHHFSIMPPSDYFWRSDQPLERFVQLAREIMDLIGAQGLVAYHPYRGKEDDDRGFWKTILGQGLDWDDARKKLVPFGHMHVVCAAPKGAIPGGAVTRALEAATGWIVERHTPRDSKVSVYGDEEMAHAVTYTLSHAMVYETDEQDARLAARVKGPDVNEIEVYDRYKREHQANVYEAAEKTLGIAAPNMECDRDIVATSTSIALSPARDSGGGSSSSASRATSLPNSSNDDVTGEVIIGSSGPVEATSSVPDTPSTSTTTRRERCGGRLRHISTAGEALPELIDSDDVDVRGLDVAYRSYVNVMRAKGFTGAHDGRAEIPEFGDRPPPD